MDTEKKKIVPRLPPTEPKLKRKPFGTFICFCMGLTHIQFAFFAWLANLSKDSKSVIEREGVRYYQYIHVTDTGLRLPLFSARVWIVWIARFLCVFSGIAFIMTALRRRMSEGKLKYFLVIPFVLPAPFLLIFGIDTFNLICDYVKEVTNGRGTYDHPGIIYATVSLAIIPLFSYFSIVFPDKYSTILAPFENVNAVKRSNFYLL